MDANEEGVPQTLLDSRAIVWTQIFSELGTKLSKEALRLVPCRLLYSVPRTYPMQNTTPQLTALTFVISEFNMSTAGL